MCNLYLFLIVFIVTFNNASGSIKRNNYNNKNNGRRCRLSISKNAKRGAKKQKVGIGKTTTLHVLHPGGGVPRISSDRDDGRIFWGFKCSNSGFYLGLRILASNFLGSLI